MLGLVPLPHLSIFLLIYAVKPLFTKFKKEKIKNMHNILRYILFKVDWSSTTVKWKKPTKKIGIIT